MRKEILRLEQVCYCRKGVNILDDFKINIFQGESLLLFGNYGSGMKELGDILIGRESITSGQVYINEIKIDTRLPLNNEKLGIYVVTDEEQLFPYLTIAENIFLSWKKNIFSRTIPVKKVNQEAERVLSQMGVTISIRKVVTELSNMDKQIIKLVKAYCKNAKLIVMNDIADIYTLTEVNELFRVLKFLQNKGIAILWITGRCSNILKYIDRLVVIKHGRHIKTYFAPDFDIEMINRIATGSNYIKIAGWIKESKNQELLRVELLQKQDTSSLVINKGEFIGLVFEDAESLEKFSSMLLGKEPIKNLKIWLNKNEYYPKSYGEAVKKGVCEIDMLNLHKNLFQNLSIEENLTLTNQRSTLPWKLFVNWKYVRFVFGGFKEKYKIPRDKNIAICSWKEQEKILFTRLKVDSTQLIVTTEFLANLDYIRWEGMIDSIQEILNKNKSFLLLSVNEGDLKHVCNRVYKFSEINMNFRK